MGDADKELKIKITTAADNSGTKQAEQGLDDLSEATKKYIKTLEEQDDKDKKSNRTKDETRRALREIGAEMPVLGEIGRAVMNPLIGAFVMLSAGVKGALDGIKELGDVGTPEMAGLTEAIKDQRDAWEELEQAAETYERTLARVTAATETMQAKSKAALGAINDKGTKDLDTADKTHAKDTALLEESEKLGLITHQEFLTKKLALDTAYEKQKASIEHNLGIAREAEEYREYQNLYAESNALEAGLAVKRAAAKKDVGDAKFRGDVGKTDEQNLASALAKITELETKAAEIHEKTTGWGKFTTLTPQVILEQQAKQTDTEIASQQAIADTLRRKIAGDTTAASGATSAANASKEDVAADEARLKANRERMRELEMNFPHEGAARTSDDAHRQQIGALDAQTRSSKFVSELGPGALDAAGAAAEALGKGQKIDAGQKAMIESLSSLLGVTHSNGKDILELIKAGHKGQEGQAREIQELRRAIEQIGGCAQAPVYTTPG